MNLEELTSIKQQVKQLEPEISSLIKSYSSMKDSLDSNALDGIKRQLIQHLMTVSFHQGRLKGEDTVYKEARKVMKSKSIQILKDQGESNTAANNLAYSEKEYESFMTSFKEVNRVFNYVNSIYYLLTTAIQSVNQSVYVILKTEEIVLK